jgi:hypothetical protein
MEAGEVFPGQDPPLSAEILHASGRTRITRLFLPGRTVIRKEPLGPDAQRRLRQDLAMLERLRGVAGVVQLVDEPRYPGSLSLADVPGIRLADVATPLDPDVLIGLGIALAEAVAGMHGQPSTGCEWPPGSRQFESGTTVTTISWPVRSLAPARGMLL